jgi:hypothetical protein
MILEKPFKINRLCVKVSRWVHKERNGVAVATARRRRAGSPSNAPEAGRSGSALPSVDAGVQDAARQHGRAEATMEQA